MATLTYADSAVVAGRGSRSLVGRLRGWAIRFRAARKVRRDLTGLRDASDHILADIGVTRGDIERALATPFWANPGDALRRRR